MKEPIKAAHGYFGFGGEVRHVIVISKVGRGYRILWDSISSRDPEYYGAQFALMRTRPHGMMAMKDFQKWAIGPLTQ